MKKILIDGTKNFYKANMHCHSINSDGNLTPAELKQAYMREGYSIIAFTDHEHVLDNSALTDENFLAINGCEVAIKQYEHLSTLKNLDMKVCHLNFYAKDPHNVDTPCYSSIADHFLNDSIRDKVVHTCGEYRRVYSREGISDMIKKASDAGYLVSYNHPHWSLENAEDYLGYKGLFAVEIHNTACMYDGLCDYDPQVYDDLLRSGQKIACLAGDDNHNDGKSLVKCFGGYTVINAERLEYGCVIDALIKHEFYVSEGPVIKELYLDDGKAFLTYEKGCTAFMQTKGRRTQRIDAENRDGLNTAVFDTRDNFGYIRFDIVDKYGKHANTNAYFTEE